MSKHTKTVSVDVGERSYEIHIDSDWSGSEALRSMHGRKALVVSDSNVDPLYGEKLDALLSESGLEIQSHHVLEAGEASKSLTNMAKIYKAAIEYGLDRKSVIVALGGGMTGDISGFAAATFMRGISYIQVPTSLLAMVDSSVGGKTAVNLDEGKNLVGSFHQPAEVAIGLNVLQTLPAREFSAGMAEVIKYGIIWDAPFLQYIQDNIDKIMTKDEETLLHVISRCCEIKAEVVAVDERESGVRGILNFGHTLGHSIENCCGYGECLHGEAVSIGTVYALRVSVLQKSLDPSEEERVRSILSAAGLPVSVKDLSRNLTWADLRRVMTADKKTVSGSPRFVLAEKMGAVVYGCEVSDDVLEGAYASLLEEQK